MEWRIESSIAPSVTSPPEICATGIPRILAAMTADRISYLSPKTTRISGLFAAKYSEKRHNAIPVAYAIPSLESSSIGMGRRE